MSRPNRRRLGEEIVDNPVHVDRLAHEITFSGSNQGHGPPYQPETVILAQAWAISSIERSLAFRP